MSSQVRRKVIASLAPVIGSMVLWAAQVGPTDAATNIWKWFVFFGIGLPDSPLYLLLVPLAAVMLAAGLYEVLGSIIVPRITDLQKVRLAQAIKPFEAICQTLIIVRPAAEPNAQALAFDFRNFFHEVTSVRATLDFIRPERRHSGIMVAVQDPSHPPPEAQALLKALNEADLGAKMVKMPHSTYKSPFVLFIGG